MVGHARRLRWRLREHFASGLVVASLLGVVVAVAVATPPDHVGNLSIILGAAAVGSGVFAAGTRDELSISASFIVVVLAAVFLGPRSAIVAAVLSELSAAIQMKTRVRAVMLNNSREAW